MRKRFAFFLVLLAVMALAACSQQPQPLINDNSSVSSQAINSGLSLPFAMNDSWILTSGPHPYSKFCGIGVACSAPWGSLDFVKPGNAAGEVRAMADGVVDAIEYDLSGVACGIRIKHDSLGLKTNYFHLLRRDVGVGQQISRGQVIGAYGSTCGYITGVHLHITLFNLQNQEVNIEDYAIGGWQPWRVLDKTYFGGLRKIAGSNPSIGTIKDADNVNNNLIFNDGTIGDGTGGGGCPPNCPPPPEATFPSAPVLQTPGTGSDTNAEVAVNGTTFSWGAISGASRYGLYISKEPYGSANLVFTKEDITGTSFSLPAGTLQANIKYRWNMTAFNGSGTNGNFASPFYFKGTGVPSSTCLDAPYPFSPELVETNAEFAKEGPFPDAWWQDSSNGSGGNSIFTYSTNTQENWAQWRFRPSSGDGYYDIYAFMPNPTSNNGAYGKDGPARAVRYNLKNRDNGQKLAESANADQNGCKGKWVKVLSEMTLYASVNYAVELPDNVYDGAIYGSQKIYYDNIGVKFLRPLVIADTTAPSVTVASPINNATVSIATLTVSGMASDNGGVTSLQYQLNGSAAQNIGLSGSNYSFNVTLNSGTNQIRVIAKDAAGNIKDAMVTVTYQLPVVPSVWTATPTMLTLSAGTVSGTATSSTFTIGNTGGPGTPTITPTNVTGISFTADTNSVATNGSKTVTVNAAACTSIGTQTATFTVSSAGATNSVTVNVTRTCTQSQPPATPPTAPTSLAVTMSSNGRIFLSWPQVNNATHYTFSATFNGQTINVTGQAQAKTGTYGSAVATFLTQPDAADKQGKEVCFQVRANTTTASSPFSSSYCTTYQYYAGTGVQINLTAPALLNLSTGQ